MLRALRLRYAIGPANNTLTKLVKRYTYFDMTDPLVQKIVRESIEKHCRYQYVARVDRLIKDVNCSEKLNYNIEHRIDVSDILKTITCIGVSIPISPTLAGIITLGFFIIPLKTKEVKVYNNKYKRIYQKRIDEIFKSYRDCQESDIMRNFARKII
jgi:hypothetical protein